MNAEAHIARGRDGWLFLRCGSNRVAEQLAGTYPLPVDFKRQWRDLLKERARYIRSLGARYVMFVAPAKEVVYRHLLPADMPCLERRPIWYVRATASGVVDFVYPLEEMQASAATTFGKQDSHWTADGGLIAYRTIMQALGLQSLAADDIQVVHHGMNDLGTKIDLPPRIERYCNKPVHPRHRVAYDNQIKPLGNMIITEVDDPSLPTAVVFRDSFLSNSLLLYAQHFRRMVVVWQPNLDRSIIEAERPDFVISAMAERFAVCVPDDRNGATNAENVARKMAA